MRKITLLFTFYKSYALVSLITTLSYLIITYQWGDGTFLYLLWFKVITLGIILYFINIYKRNEFYYYKNLGLQKQFLMISTALFDLLLFIVLNKLTLHVR